VWVKCSGRPGVWDGRRRSWRAERERAGRLTVRARLDHRGDVLSVATAVKLHGEGGGSKEERLVLRTIGGRDQPGQGARPGRG
jgi:hypothetical protein